MRAKETDPSDGGAMIAHLTRWIRGEIPLPYAFWLYAVGYGTIANLVVTALALGVLAAGGPGWLALAVFLTPLPYNLLAVVAVWRSADRYADPAWARTARIAVVTWAILATLI
jgi:hypothetical protein